MTPTVPAPATPPASSLPTSFPPSSSSSSSWLLPTSNSSSSRRSGPPSSTGGAFPPLCWLGPAGRLLGPSWLRAVLRPGTAALPPVVAAPAAACAAERLSPARSPPPSLASPSSSSEDGAPSSSSSSSSSLCPRPSARPRPPNTRVLLGLPLPGARLTAPRPWLGAVLDLLRLFFTAPAASVLPSPICCPEPGKRVRSRWLRGRPPAPGALASSFPPTVCPDGGSLAPSSW